MRARLIAVLAAAACSLAPAAAQISTPLGRPSEERPPLPEIEPRGPALEQTLPPIPPLPRESLSSGVRVFVRDYRFEGNAAIATAELDALAAPYRGRTITSDELDELRRRITALYVERGYISSGALVPDQRVADGIVRVDVIEGELTAITVAGAERLRPAFVADRIELGAGPPLDVNELQERLRRLVDSPLVDRLNADLQPGVRPGEARLDVKIEESGPGALSVGVDNHVSPSVGGVRGRAAGSYRNFLGRGDVAYGEVALGEGLLDVFAEYTVPLNAYDTTLGAFGQLVHADVVEEPFDRIDVESESSSYGLRLAHPVYRWGGRTLTLSAELARRRSRTFLLGRGFPFSPGVEPDGESKVTVLRFGQDWLARTPRQVVAARSTVSLGLGAFDSTDAARSPGDPTGKFVSWLLQLQWVRRIEPTGGQLNVRGDLQLAADSLLPLEQFSIGGARSVRGYRENQVVHDQGYVASLEYRHPLRFDEVGRSTLELAVFYDHGDAWNKDLDTVPDRGYLSSVGLGLRWTPAPRYLAELYWAVPLRDVDDPGGDLQDAGLHFALVATPFD